jgi:hypothetical protein
MTAPVMTQRERNRALPARQLLLERAERPAVADKGERLLAFAAAGANGGKIIVDGPVEA